LTRSDEDKLIFVIIFYSGGERGLGKCRLSGERGLGKCRLSSERRLSGERGLSGKSRLGGKSGPSSKCRLSVVKVREEHGANPL
jgi:hypothetical protein